MNAAVRKAQAEFGAGPFADCFAASPGLAERRPLAIVCLMTFRRPAMLRATLDSLVAQFEAPPFALVVVENDAADPVGAAVARDYFRTGRLDGLCVIEPAPGNCSAANRAFGEARRRFPSAEFVLMIDDDEIADPRWLVEIVGAARRTGADIVGGPVVPRFPEGMAPALAEHPIYWPAYDRSGPVRQIYGSGNFLIRRDAYARLANPDFDLAYNYLGGGDTDFFTRCRRAGMKFHWAQEAIIEETVPWARAETRWVIQRGLRIGAINHRVDRVGASSRLGHAKVFAKTFALPLVALFRTIRLMAAGKAPLVALHPCFVAAGRFFGAFGFAPEQYRPVAQKTPA